MRHVFPAVCISRATLALLTYSWGHRLLPERVLPEKAEKEEGEEKASLSDRSPTSTSTSRNLLRRPWKSDWSEFQFEALDSKNVQHIPSPISKLQHHVKEIEIQLTSRRCFGLGWGISREHDWSHHWLSVHNCKTSRGFVRSLLNVPNK